MLLFARNRKRSWTETGRGYCQCVRVGCGSTDERLEVDFEKDGALGVLGSAERVQPASRMGTSHRLHVSLRVNLLRELPWTRSGIKMAAMSFGPGDDGFAPLSDRSLRPRMSRVVIFFLVSFGFVLLPFALAGLDLALAPAPYVIHPEALPRGGSSIQHFDDASVVTVLVLPTEDAATSAVAGIVRATPTRSFWQMNGQVALSRYYNAVTGRACAWLRIGSVAVGVEAADRAAVDRRLANLAVVTKNTAVDPLFAVFDRDVGTILVGVGIYALAMALFMLRAASWAARVDPAPGTLAVSASELRSRLLQVNEFGLPWRLEEPRPGFFRAEWVYLDARWLQAQGAGRISSRSRLTLRLDESRRRVSVIESVRTVSYGAGFAGLFASLSLWRGITFFAYETGVGTGLGFRDGKWQLAELYRYRFSSNEMQNPLVEAIVDGGWTYAPSLTLIPWLGG